MKIDIAPKKITAPGMKHSIFTGTKYAFIHFDRDKDLSWDGEKEKIDLDKSVSVLWNEKELAAFRPNDTVHGFLQSLKEGQEEEIKNLKKRKQSNKWKDKLTGEIIDLRARDNERAKFLEENDIIFVEITFEPESN